MNKRRWALVGIVGPVVSYLTIAVSILLSSWFSWERNALSDLGHATRSSVSPLFNFGLLVGGSLSLIYAVTLFRQYAPYTSLCFTVAAFALQLVATFNETYGGLHYVVSVLFFASLGVAALVYSLEKKSVMGILMFLVGVLSWALYGRLYTAGIAVPETISSVAVVSLILYSALRIYHGSDLPPPATIAEHTA